MKNFSKSILWSVLLGSSAALSTLSAQAFTPFELTQTFNNPDPQNDDRFGNSVSINGTNALIGALGDDTGADGAGSVYLFDTETGNLLQTINNPTPNINDSFGFSVAIEQANALIGSPTIVSSAGSAYLFDTEADNSSQTLNNPDSQISDRFGLSVSISGANTLIGAFGNNTGASRAGSAYLFDTETANFLQTFNNPTPQAGDNFGRSVSISGTKALIGALGDNTGALRAGSAYLFDTETDHLRTFNNPTPEEDDFFGFSVSIDNTYALIGAYQDDTGAVNAGSAYLFDTETGNLLQTFNNPTPQAEDFFGYSVSISGTNALIGAFGDDTGALGAGSVYLFDTETGNLLQTLNNPDPQSNDQFGFSVSINDTDILIGTRYDDTGANDAGSAYLYQTDSTSVPEPGNMIALFLTGLSGILVRKFS